MAVCVTNTGHVVCEKPATAIKIWAVYTSEDLKWYAP